MDKKSSDCLYFRMCLRNIATHPLIIISFIVIEQLSIFSNTFISVIKCFNRHISVKNEYLFYVSVFNSTKYLSVHSPIAPAIYFSIGVLITIVYFVNKITLYYSTQYNSEAMKHVHKTLSTLFEYFWFRIYGLFFYDALIYYICFVIKKQLNETMKTAIVYVILIVLITVTICYLVPRQMDR